MTKLNTLSVFTKPSRTPLNYYQLTAFTGALIHGNFLHNQKNNSVGKIPNQSALNRPNHLYLTRGLQISSDLVRMQFSGKVFGESINDLRAASRTRTEKLVQKLVKTR